MKNLDLHRLRRQALEVRDPYAHRVSRLLVGISLVCILSGICQPLAAKHLALIIGIAEYPESSGWSRLSSDTDIKHITVALHTVGFEVDDIHILQDADATRSGILSAFDALSNRAQKGDIVYIHYSGHGQQVVDQDGDEMDNLDEAIVPVNSPMYYKEGYNHGEQLIRDDELRVVLTALRKRLGTSGQLLLIMDSCHSGTASRGVVRARGTDVVMAPDGYTPAVAMSEGTLDMTLGTQADMADLLALYASSSRELNYETTDDQNSSVGSLSYAVSTVLLTRQSPLSFHELYRRVRQTMMSIAPRQTPQSEGPREAMLFGESSPIVRQSAGSAVATRYSIIDWIDPHNLKVNMGTAQKIYTGSTVQLMQQASGSIITSGIVQQAGLQQSTVRLKDPVAGNPQDYYTTLSNRAFPPIIITAENLLNQDSQWQSLWSSLCDRELIREQKDTPELLLVDTDDGGIAILSKVGHELYRSQSDKTATESTMTFLTSYAQGKYLRSMNHEIGELKMELHLLPTDCRTHRDALGEEIGAFAQIPVNTCARVHVKNIGQEGAYFSVLDIQTDNQTQLIVPSSSLGYTAEEYYLEAGAEYISDFYLKIGLPAGNETFKIIVSRKPLELSSIVTSKGTASRDAYNNPFEQLMAESFNHTEKKSGVLQSETDAVGVYSFSFTITE